ncbi:hypothetical protein JOQ06_007145 [Pogonophryne albipinna]|uniref:Uncharacterized protein n=1 Tax=Pogonophryne albipinna TaxID=1090488 RepID=A0AAD6B095_9TELE|nr:hypothetical protein JOQ06_007145 [Pogonophryne albipinna]
MPARTREARCLVFKGKRPAISTPAAQHSKRAKHPKGAELRELGSGFRSGMAARPYPLATDIEEKEEEEDEANFDVDVESLFPDTDEEGLSSGQPQAGPEAEGAESSTQLSHLTRALVERLLEPSVLTPWQRLTPPPPSLMRLGGRLPRGLSRNGRRAGSPPRGPAPGAHSGPRSSPQPGEEQLGAFSSHTIYGHGYRLKDHHCVSYLGEAGDFQGLPGTFLPGGKGHLEIVSASLGADGGNGPNCSIGPSLHAPSTEVPPQPETAPTDTAAGQGAGNPQAATGPPLVGTLEQSSQGEQTGFR